MRSKTTYAILLSAILAGVPVMSAAGPGNLAGSGSVPQPRFTNAAADCYAVGQRVAAQAGGQLAAARAATRGGQAVCVVVVLVPGRDGQRPRRQEIVVPQ